MVGLSTGILAVLLAALALTLVVAARQRNGAAIVNVLVSLAVTLFSIVVAGGFQSPWLAVHTSALPLWVTLAGLLHSIGMLGPYESVWWWDHLTHTVSAALVTALLYAGLLVAVAADATLTLSPAAVAVVAVLYTFVLGVFWELGELVARAIGERYGIEPVLVHYGWRDTGFDLAFDLVGAVVVVALDVRVFVDLATRFPEVTQALLVWTAGVVTVGSLVMALSLGVRSG